MKRIGTLSLCVALITLSVTAVGCAPTPTHATAIEVGGESGITARFPDGTVARGYGEYEAALTRIVPRADKLDTLPMTVTDDAHPAAGPPGTQQITWMIGKFAVSIDPSFDYVGGCIRKHYLHLAVTLENKIIPAPLVELHFVAWLEGNRPCVGVMNTSFVGYGWCQKLCWTATREDVKRAIAAGLVAGGIAGTTAAILANVITPVAAVALAL
jgi:hypothetical protein